MKRRRPPVAMIVSIVSVLVIIGAGAAYLAAAEHSVLPGIKGCEVMREVTPQSRCVATQLEHLTDGVSTEAGLRRIDALAASNPLVQAHCHLAMHVVGERAGRRDAKRGEIPEPVGDSTTCRKGFTHGAMLGYISSAKDISITAALGGLCKPEAGAENDCVHVLGHLIARRAGDRGAGQELADKCTATDIATEAGHTVSAADEHECLRGGYMELAINEHQPPLATWSARCERAPARGRVECFAWLPPIAAYRQLPKSDAAAQCHKLDADSAARRDCETGIARAV